MRERGREGERAGENGEGGKEREVEVGSDGEREGGGERG